MKTDKIINILLIISVTIPNGDGFTIYGLHLSYFTIFALIFVALLKKKYNINNITVIESYTIYFSLAYLYGLLLGFFHENHIINIFRNFFGLLLFAPIYFICIRSFSLERIIRLSKAIAYIYIAQILIYLTIGLIFGDEGGREIGSKYGIDGLANQSLENSSRYFLTGSAWIFIFFSFAFHSILFSNFNFFNIYAFSTIKNQNIKYIINFSYITLIIYLLIYLTQSKGFLLALIFISTTLVLALFTARNKIKSYLLILLFVTPIVFLFLNNFTPDAIFDETSSGNSIRQEQIGIVIERLSIMGKGLGADFGDYTRSLDKSIASYGIELTYLNILDKLGILGLPIVVFYFFITIKFAILTIIKKEKLIGLLGIGLTAFVWPSIGNPMLLSVGYIIAALFAIKLLSINKVKYT